MILITGAGGMLGRYLLEEFKEENVKSLGLRDNSDFRFDLTKDMPEFENHDFTTIIHTAGTEKDEKALELNFEGTKRLLEALDKQLPQYLVYISSYKVYSRDAGENINEDENTWASDEVGRSKALAEQYVMEWAKKRGVVLTIIRPARMFGNGVSGETLQLFNDAVSGKYIHIRGNESRISLVTALDVARGIKKIYRKGGIYNVADGRNPKFIEMVESMTANGGAKKRMTCLPASWAEWIWRLGRWVPYVNRNLSPEVVELRMKSLTLDGSKFAEAAGLKYYDTISVMELTDQTYPYTSKTDMHLTKHEV